jgi:hypothetical protein
MHDTHLDVHCALVLFCRNDHMLLGVVDQHEGEP